VYDIAVAVAACLRAGTRVDVAWVLDSDLEPPPGPADAVALTPGGGRIGTLLHGALDDRLADAGTGRLLTLDLSPLEAKAMGRRGGRVRCLVVPADSLPADLWRRLAVREPVRLLTRLEKDRIVDTVTYDAGPEDPVAKATLELVARGSSGSVLTEHGVITVLCPLPRLAVLGSGPIIDALAGLADVLGWSVHRGDVTTIAGLAPGLTPRDALVVMSHDVDAAGTVLAEALDGRAGYIGALGSARMQQARARWLADRGITDLSRIHGPAGLDLGAAGPGEMAVAILAEAIAVRTGHRLGQHIA